MINRSLPLMRKKPGIALDADYAAFSKGVAGIVDTARDAARTYWGAAGMTTWQGFITGRRAEITGVRSSGSLASGNFVVSIDGEAPYNAVFEKGRFILYSGLSDKTRFITISASVTIGGALGTLNSGVILTAYGAKPAISTADTWINFYDNNPSVLSSSIYADLTAPYNVGYTPAPAIRAQASYTQGHRFKTDATRMFVVSASRYVYVSVDGGTTVRYDRGVKSIYATHVINLDGTVHTYNVWCRNSVILSPFGKMSIGINGALYDPGQLKRMDQYGSSSTAGAGATDPGDVDIHGVAAHFGYLGVEYGIAGDTFDLIDARLDTLLPQLKPAATSSDVAVYAVGTNNLPGGWDSAEQAACLSNITKMRAVYGKVLVRGVLPYAGDNRATENGILASMVSGMADPNVIHIDTTSWTGITYNQNDNTHPDDAGYDTIEAYCKTAYAPYL